MRMISSLAPHYAPAPAPALQVSGDAVVRHSTRSSRRSKKATQHKGERASPSSNLRPLPATRVDRWLLSSALGGTLVGSLIWHRNCPPNDTAPCVAGQSTWHPYPPRLHQHHQRRAHRLVRSSTTRRPLKARHTHIALFHADLDVTAHSHTDVTATRIHPSISLAVVATCSCPHAPSRRRDLTRTHLRWLCIRVCVCVCV